ncbi:hydrogenase maturation nickel metallochaperone HypA [Actimicrobium sp. CCI2.3]|uniref:hydrogenase maturation nickel metallochaperone HypA/HybF n=1 Tax=Actimicrobium sp. CCI2.3 TaxID=3048616 RepID=UPI002AB4C34E|nr:hydrogenase maturation nickel metallochaperone HypA [Actimicrobium sp. CCI2.3]MDY7573903.1 hydrogenase maturation nickel metallochaperone HypA [Actimicrobium sp. CCI2.3]MEB0024096.1 hydrogenase maturation nickel metallochaperone HypA [Actimicrobium sp. CCI2.3]
MHEVSLASGILKIVEAAALREKFARVTLLRIEAGSLCNVEVRALRFALEVMAQDTCLQDAEIAIDTPTGAAWCLHCQLTVPLQAHGDACPQCGNYQLRATGGAELRVLEMMVEDT